MRPIRNISIFSSFLVAFGPLALSSGAAMDWGGDFRYRYEYKIDDSNDSENQRQRIRARIQGAAQVNEKVKAEIRVATGNNEPSGSVSGNQTLGNFFSKKTVVLDKANFTWAPMPELAIAMGKFENPFRAPAKTELVWDGDLTPEGISLAFSRDMGALYPFLNLSYWILEDRKNGLDDAYITGAQIGTAAEIGTVGLEWGVSWVSFRHLRDLSPIEKTDLLEAYLELTRPGRVPAGIFGDFVINYGADEDQLGYLAGLVLGKAKQPHTAQAMAYWKYLESNAIFTPFGDSDFGGGRTGVQGLEAAAKYQLLEDWALQITYFWNHIGLESNDDFQQVQLDVSAKF